MHFFFQDYFFKPRSNIVWKAPISITYLVMVASICLKYKFWNSVFWLNVYEIINLNFQMENKK